MPQEFEAQAFLVFGLIGLSLGIIMVLFLFLGWKRQVIHGDRSPYSNAVMQFGIDIARSLQVEINEFMREFPEEDNPPIDFTKAALCPVTGRIFPNSVVKSKKISLDWSFIKKRCPGTFISWGSLPEDEKGIIRVLHSSLDGFQTESSSMFVRPEAVEREHSLLSPGPLYVDRTTKILVGWKLVPGTSFEVLVVQRPLFQSIDETL